MQYNPRADQAQAIEKVAAECAAAVARLCPPGKPGKIQWSEAEGRWVHA